MYHYLLFTLSLSFTNFFFFFSFQCKELKDARRKGGKKKKIEIDFFYKTTLVRLTVQVNLT